MSPLTQPLLILDLDETLFYASREALPRRYDLLVEQYFVYMRPMLWNFLDAIEQYYALAVWTSSGRIYAEMIVQKLFPPGIPFRFIWSREHCTPCVHSGQNVQHKDLNRLLTLGYELARVLIVEDTPEKVLSHPENLVRIPPYFGAVQDDALLRLSAFLTRIAGVPDFRKLDKQPWNP